jgi:hypothetical protein
MTSFNHFDSIYALAVTSITNDLTTGRNDQDLVPFSQDEINVFITKNKENIEQAVKDMIFDYSSDSDTVDLLENPSLSMINEYLYEYLKY